MGRRRTLRRRIWATCALATDFRSVYATVLERWLGRPSATVLARRLPAPPRPELNASILFLGSGGARFVVARQLRASGGMWMRFGETQMHVDPGPGALVRALSHVPPCNPRELDAIVLSHKHLDHSGDVNALIEAMTSGGFRRRGAVLAPADAFDDEPVVLPYAQRFVERVERLNPAAVRTASAGSSSTRRAARARRQNVRHCISSMADARFISACGRYFDGLAARLCDAPSRRAGRQRAPVSRRDERRSFDWQDACRVVPRCGRTSPSFSILERRCSKPIRFVGFATGRRAGPAGDRRLRRLRSRYRDGGRGRRELVGRASAVVRGRRRMLQRRLDWQVRIAAELFAHVRMVVHGSAVEVDRAVLRRCRHDRTAAADRSLLRRRIAAHVSVVVESSKRRDRSRCARRSARFRARRARRCRARTQSAPGPAQNRRCRRRSNRRCSLAWI